MDRNDTDLILLLAAAGPCSLDSSPKKNWVERAGGLPNYICHIAKGIMKSGKSKSQAISIAVSRVKKWAAGGDDVDADTRAKSAKAVAQWEKLKAKNAAKQVVKASHQDGFDYLILSNTGSFNTEWVRRAWEVEERKLRVAYEKLHHSYGPASAIDAPASALYPYRWIREVWSDHLIVEIESEEARFIKVPYTVNGTEVSFSDPIPVEQDWVELSEADELSEAEKGLLADVFGVKLSSPLGSIMALHGGR